jgi:hypothetical protein
MISPKRLVTVVLGFLFLVASTSAFASQRADAVLLVNSASSSYADAQHFTRPYLDNLGIPYTVLDIATTPVGAGIETYALIVVGHRRLDPSDQFLDASEEANLALAVWNGSGLVNFDNDLSPGGGAPRYQFIQSIFNFGYVSPPTDINVNFTASGPSHFIAARHTGGEQITTGPMTTAGIVLPPAVTSLANVGASGQTFLAVTTYGQGRAVQWGGYQWMSGATKGPVYGLDDLVWRSLVWAARKPFVMQGLPNFVTMRVDDSQGQFWWVDIANTFNIKPWIGLFYKDVSNPDAAVLSNLVNSGKATASVHASTGIDFLAGFFYFDQALGGDYSDTTVAAKFGDATAWHTAHNIPISKYVLGHYYQLGTNVFGGLQQWGVEFVGTEITPGSVYTSAPWLNLGPYRLYESAPATDAIPGTYADFLSVPGHPEFQNRFFNCLTEIRDDAGYEWYPDNDIQGTIGRGTRQTRRALDSMVLATLFTHDQHIQPISPSNWTQELQGITSNLASYNPRYVTLDYACQYVRAVHTSNISSSSYDPATGVLSTQLAGSADMATQFYVFNNVSGNISGTLVDVPAFSGSVQVPYPAAGPLDHVVVSPSPGIVPTGGMQQFTAQGYDVANNPIPGLSFSWSATAGGTISPSGLFTAGTTIGVYTNAVSASSGGVTGRATVQVYTPVLDHFVFDTVAGPVYAGTPFGIRISASDQNGRVLGAYPGPAQLSDPTGTITPTVVGPFSAGVWTGNATIALSASGVALTASNGSISGTSNSFIVLAAQSGTITINCWEDAHQSPVLPTTTDANQINTSDGIWTEFWYQCCRSYPSVFAGADEENIGLPVMRFYANGIQNGAYRVWGKLYTNDPGRDMRYYYGFSPEAPKAFYVDTVGGAGGGEQHADYDLGTVNVSSGTFSIYVRDADLLSGSYPVFGWASIRLECAEQAWYRDGDADGYGSPGLTGQGCSAPAGYVAVGGDCNDANSSVHPGASEANCNGIDDNCNGTTDEGYVPVPTNCGVGACTRTGATLCVGGAVQSSCVPGVPTPEVCDGIDNNCDGAVDVGAGPTWFRDADGDAHGVSTPTLQACSQPSGYAAIAGDCNDADAQAFGFPAEVINVILSPKPNGTQLDWTDQAATAGSGTRYDVVSGLKSELVADNGYAHAICLANGVTTNKYRDTRSSPPAPGSVIYYLLRAKNSCGHGTFGNSTLVPDRRDALDASACP